MFPIIKIIVAGFLLYLPLSLNAHAKSPTRWSTAQPLKYEKTESVFPNELLEAIKKTESRKISRFDEFGYTNIEKKLKRQREELHIISNLSPPSGYIQKITIEKTPKPVVLFIAVSPFSVWDFVIEPHADLKKVIFAGKIQQIMHNLPSDIPVEEIPWPKRTPKPSGWKEIYITYKEYDDFFVRYETWGLKPNFMKAINKIRRITGLYETSYQEIKNIHVFIPPKY